MISKDLQDLMADANAALEQVAPGDAVEATAFKQLVLDHVFT